MPFIIIFMPFNTFRVWENKHENLLEKQNLLEDVHSEFIKKVRLTKRKLLWIHFM